jgi:hypothetical protein
MPQPTDLEIVFHRRMLEVYHRAKAECGYNATRFLQMVSNEGGLKLPESYLRPQNLLMVSPYCGKTIVLT